MKNLMRDYSARRALTILLGIFSIFVTPHLLRSGFSGLSINLIINGLILSIIIGGIAILLGATKLPSLLYLAIYITYFAIELKHSGLLSAGYSAIAELGILFIAVVLFMICIFSKKNDSSA